MTNNSSVDGNFPEIDYCTQGSVSNCTQRTSNVPFGVARIVFSIPGLILNVLFIATMIRNKSLRTSLMLLTLLSFADCLISAYVLSFGISDLVADETPFCIKKISCFYMRPQLSLQICALQLQSIATFFVALERFVAIVFPMFYYKSHKTNVLLAICGLTVTFVACSFIASIIVTSQDDSNTYSDLCFPTRVVGRNYGGFIYLFSAILGCLAVVCYAVIFCVKLYEKISRKIIDDSTITNVHKRRETWLMKICCILTLSDFLLIVTPHIVLYLGMPISCPDSILWFMRRYVSFLFSTNSFLGMTISLVVSKELRLAVLDTITCDNRHKLFESEEEKMKRLSSSDTKISKAGSLRMGQISRPSNPT